MSDAVRAVTVGRAIPLPGNDDRHRYRMNSGPVPEERSRSDGLGEAACSSTRACRRPDLPAAPMRSIDARYIGASILLVGRNFGCG